MGVHSLEIGKSVISNITTLGKALKYVVREEFPVERLERNAPAVDVAWMSEEGQDFPLMIFEIESKVTNSVTNNPAKVFGQTIETFEKPLFFFHVFAQGPSISSRVENLNRLFGSHNYRTYNLSHNESTKLVKDILSQHRRLYPSIDIRAFINALRSMTMESLNADEILIHAESLKFHANFLKEYALLTIEDENYKKHFIRFLSNYINAHQKTVRHQIYGTYWGDEWSVPIHYGILINLNLDTNGLFVKRFIAWQEKSSYLSMIGPHFGLSRDYDEFILTMAPPFWAFLTALMKHCSQATSFIANQCQIILEKLTRFAHEVSFFTAIWLLHISAAANSENHYEFARIHINKNGGISEIFLYDPPNTIPLNEVHSEADKRWKEELQSNPTTVPIMSIFKKSLTEKVKGIEKCNNDEFTLAMKVLTDPGVNSAWAASIIRLLSIN